MSDKYQEARSVAWLPMASALAVVAKLDRDGCRMAIECETRCMGRSGVIMAARKRAGAITRRKYLETSR